MADWKKLYCSAHNVTSDAFDWQEDMTDFEDTHAECVLVVLYESQDGDFDCAQITYE